MGVADYLARINLLLFVFNLVPALPLDGGRVLHAWLWRRRRSHTAATLVAARAGRAFGVLLAAVGGVGLLAGGGVSGVWLVFLGLFIVQAAQDEATYTLVEHTLGGVPVRDLMVPVPVTVPTLPTGSLGRGPDGCRPDVRLPGRPARRHRRAGAGGRGAGRHRPGGRAAVQRRRARGRAAAAPARGGGAAGPPAPRWLVVAAGVIVAGGLLYHPPYVVIMPGSRSTSVATSRSRASAPARAAPTS